MNGQFIIVGAGSLAPDDLQFTKKPGDFLVAADAGFLAIKRAGLLPDLVVGDFDSMPEKALFEPSAGASESVCPEIIRLPVEKDDTDIAFCIKEGFLRGYSDFVIYGALGGSRLSHTVANLQLLSMVKERGGTASLMYGGTRAFVLSEGEEAHFPTGTSGALSAFSLSEEAAVTLTGLFYPLENGILTRKFPLGVSNHFTGKEARVLVHRGEVLIITEKE